MKTKIIIVIGIFLLLVGIFWYHFHNIHRTVRKGEAYGFRIGDSKVETFSHIASKHNVKWVTISYVSYRIDGSSNKETRQLEDVAEEFSDWFVWRIYDLEPENKIIGLSFESWRSPKDRFPTLQFMWRGKELYIGEGNERLSVWQPPGEKLPCLRLGMSYTEVYHALLKLNALEASNNLMVKPKGYKKIKDFTDEELKRIAKWNAWDVDLSPDPIGYGTNHLSLRFKHEKLIEITRIRRLIEF